MCYSRGDWERGLESSFSIASGQHLTQTLSPSVKGKKGLLYPVVKRRRTVSLKIQCFVQTPAFIHHLLALAVCGGGECASPPLFLKKEEAFFRCYLRVLSFEKGPFRVSRFLPCMTDAPCHVRFRREQKKRITVLANPRTTRTPTLHDKRSYRTFARKQPPHGCRYTGPSFFDIFCSATYGKSGLGQQSLLLGPHTHSPTAFLFPHFARRHR